MSKSSEQVVHNTVNAIVNCEITLHETGENLPVHLTELAHALLPKIAGSMPACCTLADLLTATYLLGASRALASVAAGLEAGR